MMPDSQFEPNADQVIHAVSHELNTALTMVLGNAHLLRSKGDDLDPVTRRAALSDLEQQAERLSSAIQNLLLLARLEMGLRPFLEPVVLPRLLTELIDQESARENGRTVMRDLEKVSQPVTVDRNLFRVILRNVIENACLYSHQGGEIKVNAFDQAGKVQIEIADDGPAIEPDEREAIFQPFYRSPKVVGTVPGLGLGLTVAQKLTQLHGGQLTLGQQPGFGATFVISLPAARYMRV